MVLKFSAENPAQIMVVDDHPFVREGISLLLNREPDLNVCCETGNADEALAFTKQYGHHLVVLDLALGETYSYDLIRQLRLEFPKLLVLVISMHEESVYAERALKAGAHGYVMKQAAKETLLHAIRQVLEGDLYVSNRMRTRLLNQLINGPSHAKLYDGLSAVELQILQLIGNGMKNAEIAKSLNRSIKTIEAHRSNIRHKLKIYSGHELVRYAIQWVEKQTASKLIE